MTVRDLYTKLYPVHDTGFLKRLVKATNEIKLKKNEFLIKQDEIDKNIYFLKTGIIISTLIYSSGKVTCLGIHDEPGEILVGGLGPACPYSPINLVARTACEVYYISMKDISQFMEEYPERMLTVYNQIILKEYEKQWQSKNMLYIDSAEERYRWFLKHYPGVIEKLSHETIASFLHMSPVTFSRVRNKKKSII